MKDYLTTPGRSLLLTIAIAALLTISGPAPAAEAGAWQSAFTGKDLAGWKVPEPNPFWRVEDGMLVGQNDENLKGNMLWTEKAYRDVEVEVEARWTGEIDSGIMVRKPELQLQIGVSRSLKKDMTCSFYTGGKERYPVAGQAKGLEELLKPGDWNSIRLQAKGDTFTAWLNGKQVASYTDPRFAGAAPIGLQIHPGLKMKIEFRHVRIKVLD